MNALRRIRKCRSHQVLVYLLREEGGKRGHQFCQGDKTLIQRVLHGRFVHIHFALPETAAVTADAPVGAVDEGFIWARIGGVIVAELVSTSTTS